VRCEILLKTRAINACRDSRFFHKACRVRSQSARLSFGRDSPVLFCVLWMGSFPSNRHSNDFLSRAAREDGIEKVRRTGRATSESIEHHTHENLLRKDVNETLSYLNQESAIGHSIQPLNRGAVSLLLIDLADRYKYLYWI